MENDRALRDHLIKLIKGGEAHADFDRAIKNFPRELRSRTKPGVEHSAWQLLEHMRIAQWDILEFSRNPLHKSPDWPRGYWPDSDAPPTFKAWDESVKAFLADREAMCALVGDEKTDLFAKLLNGDGQTLLREAMLVADHNAYHLGQLVMLRKMLGLWK
jgi:hypothetical protein